MSKLLKGISACLALVLVTVFIAGCGNKQNKLNKTDIEQKEEKVFTVSWVPQNEQPYAGNSPIIKELEKKLRVKFKLIYLERNRKVELLNILIASGDIPDVMKLNRETYSNYLKQDVLLGLYESEIKSNMPMIFNAVENNFHQKNLWKYMINDGKIYGVPIININGAYPFIPIWRDDWLKNVGIEKVPTTLDEAEEAFYKFVNDDPDKNGEKDTYALSDRGINTIYGAYGMLPYNISGQFLWYENNGKIVAAATMPEMKQALILLNKWYKAGLIDPEFITGENKGQSVLNAVAFWNGRIGFSCPGLYYHVNPPVNELEASINYQNFKKVQGENATYALGKALDGPYGKGVTNMWGVFAGDCLVIGKSAANEEGKIEKILEIIEKTAFDEEINTLSRWGIKGVSYDIKEIDGVKEYTFINEYLENEYRQKMGVLNNGIAYAGALNVDKLKRENPMKYRYADEISNFQGYLNPVWENLPSAGQLKPALDKKIHETYIHFITGEKKLEDFEEFVNELYEMGLEQLTKEANEWYQKNNEK